MRRPAHLDELQSKARAVNRRLLDTERVGQGCVLASPAFEPTRCGENCAGREPRLRSGVIFDPPAASRSSTALGAVSRPVSKGSPLPAAFVRASHIRHCDDLAWQCSPAVG